jgi:hypothetical protein
MDIYYEINGKRYMDNYIIRQRFKMNKWELQQLMNTYPFPDKEVMKIQNKNLYSLKGLQDYIETILENNERQINGTEK